MTTPTYTYREKDKYGRSVLYGARGHKIAVVLVTMPKAYREAYGITHLTNEWENVDPATGRSRVTEFTSQREARAHFDRVLAAG